MEEKKKKDGRENEETALQSCAFILTCAAVNVALESSDILGGSSCSCVAVLTSRNSAGFRQPFSEIKRHAKEVRHCC